MNKSIIARSIAALAAFGITLGIFVAVASIAAEDQTRLAAARSAKSHVASVNGFDVPVNATR